MYKFPEHYIMEFDQTTTQDAIHKLIFPRQSNTFVLVELNFAAQLAIIVKKFFSGKALIKIIQT